MTKSNLYERIIEEENALMDRCHSLFIRLFPKSKVLHTCGHACEGCELKLDDRCTRVYDRAVEKAYYDSARNLEKTLTRKKMEGEFLVESKRDILNVSYGSAQLNAAQLKTLDIKMRYVIHHSFCCLEELKRDLESVNNNLNHNRSVIGRHKCEHIDWPDKQPVIDNHSYDNTISWLNEQIDRIASIKPNENKVSYVAPWSYLWYHFARNAEEFDIYQIEVLENKLQHIQETYGKCESQATHKRTLRNKAKVAEMFKRKYASK